MLKDVRTTNLAAPIVADFTAAAGTPLVVVGSTGQSFVYVNGTIAPVGPANVKGFGAKGDGATDDAAAIQAALDSLTEGGILWFPPGVYRVESQLTIPQGVPIVLRGSGVPNQASAPADGTEIRSLLRDGTSPAIVASYASPDFSLLSIEDLYLSGGTYAEVLANPGQGGAPLGNFVGLSIKHRYRWNLRNVRIAGFDVDGLRLEATYYGGAYGCSFMWNGCGVNAIDSPNVDGFYNCHFQYNVFGTKNVRHTFACAWEGNWKSGAYYNILNLQVQHYTPHFELNNESDTANESDIYVDTTNYLNALAIYDGTFNSGSHYSANANATHNFYGRCTTVTLNGTLHVTYGSPQNYPLFKVLGASTLIDNTGRSSLLQAGGVSIVAGAGQYRANFPYFAEVAFGGGDLPTYGRSHLRITSGSAHDLATITPLAFAEQLTLIFADGNTTVKHNTGNIRLVGAADFAATARDNLVLMYEPNDGKWHEVSRAVIA